MANAKLSPLQRQVVRVHRRLFLQALLNGLAWCWAGAILLSVGWFLLQPLLIDGPPVWLRWTVAGSAVGVATVLAVVLSVLRGPSRLIAALSLDSEFGLKERVTTSLTLAPEQEATPAGQALLQDATQRVSGLDVGSRFPVRMSWSTALVPVCAILLAVVALFYEPTKSQATASIKDDSKQPPTNAAEIEKKMRDLKKGLREKAEVAKGEKSEEIQKFEAELDKIANRPHENKEQIKERVREMTELEEAMKGREKELAEKARALKNQLQRMDKMTQSREGNDGPLKEMQKALSEGKFDKAKEEIDRLKAKLQKNQLTEKEKEQLKKQLENLKEKLERVAQQKDKEQQLKQANLDPETLKREMDALKKENEKLQDLQKLANQLAACQKCLKDGDMNGASMSLAKAGDQMKSMQGDDKDLEDLRDQLARLTDAKDSC
jgi:hypothetical protein